MQQLITIETVPMRVEYVEKQPTRKSSAQQMRLQVEKHPEDKSVSITSNDTLSIRMDSFDYNRYISSGPMTYTATAQYSVDGSLDLNVRMQGGDEANIRHAMNGIARMADAIPSASSFIDVPTPEESFGAFRLNFDLSSLMEDASLTDDYEASFLPPDLELKIIERPKVIIKYIGGPIYIPPSSDPDYIPLEEQFNIVAGEGFDRKV